MIELTTAAIDSARALAAVASPKCGAIVLFLGTTRQWTGGKETTELAYECYEEMAKR